MKQFLVSMARHLDVLECRHSKNTRCNHDDILHILSYVRYSFFSRIISSLLKE